MLTVALLSPGVAVVLDRGNSAGLLVPLLILFLFANKSGNSRLMVAAIVAMSLVKVHFVLLVLVLVLSGRLRGAFVALAISLMAHVSSFALINPQKFPLNILTWLEQISQYQQYSSVSIPWPPNISFSQSIYSVIFGFELISDFELGNILTFVEIHQGLFGPLVLAGLLITMAFFRKSINGVQMTILLSSAISLTSATTYFYYTVLAIPAILFLLRSGVGPEDKIQYRIRQSSHGSKIDFILWLASILTFVQYPIPAFIQGPLVLTSASLIGAVWMIAYTAICIVLVLGKKSKTAIGGHRSITN